MRSSTDADVDTTLLSNDNSRSFSRLPASLYKNRTTQPDISINDAVLTELTNDSSLLTFREIGCANPYDELKIYK